MTFHRRSRPGHTMDTRNVLSVTTISASLLLPALTAGCNEDASGPNGGSYPPVDRHAAIPADVGKVTPDQDEHPPVLHSDEFLDPVPVPVISTAGGEDSPFIPPNGGELYFYFVADVRQEAAEQIRDPVNGIWVARRAGGSWGEPELVWLQDPAELALNGCPWVAADEMLFCTIRSSHPTLSWFRAWRSGSGWEEWAPHPFAAELEVGELHVHGDQLYYGSPRAGGEGGQDIWSVTRGAGGWGDPVNIAAVNTPLDETRPYLTPDGQELWVTRWHEGSPAIIRSERVGGEWQEGELIVSSFAGEPTLDAQGNLYFVHHFYSDGVMLEADIYVAYRK